MSDELTRRADRLLERRRKRAQFRDANKTFASFDFDINRKINKKMVVELASGQFITKAEDALFLGLLGTGKSRFAQAGSDRVKPRFRDRPDRGVRADRGCLELAAHPSWLHTQLRVGSDGRPGASQAALRLDAA